ncbi:hypothetical protein MZM54_03870 [[Brevibacterium] frigoritolerans]|nr:hypothetical protein [Peribacillus frigoritolerans]
MKLEWYEADKDAVAVYKDFVFRIHKSTIEKSILASKKNIDVYLLQVRKKNNVSFTNLDYAFYQPCDVYFQEYALKRSVDHIFWGNIDRIKKRAEELLVVLQFIPPLAEEVDTK